ncbi:MAG: diaminopimelate epimerase [Gaiellales bacterium]
MRFSKWHGIGNDFLIVDEQDLDGPLSEQAVIAICDRNFGVGADGILVLGGSSTADAHMLIHNADGSMAEMCGNGIRVAARWLLAKGRVTPGGDGTFTIETAGGIMRPSVLDDGRVRVDMGIVTSEGIADVDLGTSNAELVGHTLTGRVVHVGNPHFVVRRAPEGPELHRLGPSGERHPRFPNRTNVEFWEIDDHDAGRVRMRVWERGVGETLACGTGACAVAFTARTDADMTGPITVALPGGELEIEFDGDRAFMTGAAHHAWDGALDPALIVAGLPSNHRAMAH